MLFEIELCVSPQMADRYGVWVFAFAFTYSTSKDYVSCVT